MDLSIVSLIDIAFCLFIALMFIGAMIKPIKHLPRNLLRHGNIELIRKLQLHGEEIAKATESRARCLHYAQTLIHEIGEEKPFLTVLTGNKFVRGSERSFHASLTRIDLTRLLVKLFVIIEALDPPGDAGPLKRAGEQLDRAVSEIAELDLEIEMRYGTDNTVNIDEKRDRLLQELERAFWFKIDDVTRKIEKELVVAGQHTP